MKITVISDSGKGIHINLPNALLFSPTLLNFGLRVGKHYAGEEMPNIPPEVMRQLCAILKDYSKKHGPLELVRVDSADGDRVIITI